MNMLIIIAGLSADAPSGTYHLTGGDVLPLSMDAAANTAADQTLLLLDGRDCAHLRVQLPAKSEAQAAAAAPFAVEDMLAQPIEDCHVALGSADVETGMRLVIAVDRAAFKGLLDRLANQGLRPSAVYSEALLLDGLQTPSLDLDDRILLTSSDSGVPMEIDANMLPLMQELGAVPPARGKQQFMTALKALPGGLTKTAQPNVLQGAFAPRRAWGDIWVIWQRSTAAIGLAFAFFCAATAVEAITLNAKSADIDQSARADMRAAFPGVRGVDHMLQRLGSLQGENGDPFLDLAGAALSALQAADGVKLDAMRYDDSRTELSLSLVARSFDDVQSLKARLARMGITLREGTSRQSSGQVMSDVALTRGAQ